MTTSDKRQRLVEAARVLFHRQGYAGTPLADVAEESGVPIGNLYYYFKTKQALAEAVVDLRLEEIEAMVTDAERESEPARRLEMALRTHEEGAEEVARYGCPYGCLAQEFERMGGPLGRRSARLLESERSWMKRQFLAMGYDTPAADSLSLELLAGLHGAMVVGHSFRSAAVIRKRFASLREWIHTRAAEAGA